MIHQLSHIKALDPPVNMQARLSRQDQDKLHELKHYLEQNFLQNFTLDGLTRLTSLKTFKLKTGCRELFSVSVFGMIRQLRMQYAEQQLKDCNVTVGEMAFQLGYQHTQHFSAAFKKHHGHSPSHFKQNGIN